MENIITADNCRMMESAIVIVLLFIGLIFTRIHRTVLGLVAVSVVFLLNIASYEDLVRHVDVNVIMLLVAMMLIVAVMRRTGLFQYIAMKSAKLAGGDPLKLLILFAIATAVISAFFDNVTTILLMSPITLFICSDFGINPIPFLVTQAIASNFGGTATLIGDPPNIMIGSAAGLSFTQFVINLAPLVLIVTAGYAFIMRVAYRKKVGYASAAIKARLASIDTRKSITDKILLKRGLIILALTLIGFFIQKEINLEAGEIALCGAAALLLVSRADVTKVLEELEWTTIIFFACLYIVVGAADESGLIRKSGSFLFNANLDSFSFAMIIMWISALLSAFIGSVPVAAIMIPLIKTHIVANPHLSFVWWALAIGVCFGGNLTLIGAAANIIAAGIVEKNGYRITFKTFFLHGAPVTILALVLSSLYIYLRYILFY
ncbi:MAG: SLC13 family permease [Planctomycetota bacterium]